MPDRLRAFGEAAPRERGQPPAATSTLEVRDGDLIEGAPDKIEVLDLGGDRAEVEPGEAEGTGTIHFLDADGARTGETVRYEGIDEIVGATRRS